jgi:hypothetical protein
MAMIMTIQRTFVAVCLVALPLIAKAQFGFQAEYMSLNSPWEDTQPEPDGEYLDQLVSVSALYWFRLKEKRIEFLPQLGYAFTLGGSDAGVPIKQKRFTLAFNTDIYLFDIINDCNCPTFSKQGGTFERSFFIELSPALDYQMIKTENFPSAEDPNKDEDLTFRFGLGAGFDIGVSDLITVTPIIHADYGMRPDWTGNPNWPSPPPEDISGGEWMFRAGVRVMFRPDYINRFR